MSTRQSSSDQRTVFDIIKQQGYILGHLDGLLGQDLFALIFGF